MIVIHTIAHNMKQNSTQNEGNLYVNNTLLQLSQIIENEWGQHKTVNR